MLIGFDASRAFGNERTGTENYSHELLRSLLAIDHENTYRLYLRSKGLIADDLFVKKNVETKHIKLPKLWTQAGLAWEVLENPPDVLFVPAHTLPVIHRQSLKSLVTIHDLGAEYLPQYHQFPQKLYLNRSTEYAVKHATHLIAVSQATKDDLVKRLNADPKKISVIHEGFDASRFAPATKDQIDQIKKKYQIQGAYLLFVGTIQPRKNLERVIEAFARVKSDKKATLRPASTGAAFGRQGYAAQAGNMRGLDNLTLILAGKKGWLSGAIYEAPKKHDVQSQVTFLDFVGQHDLPALYSGAEAFVFPSLFEGFGLPVLEAMACGTPVITSNSSSLPEVGGEAAYYVDPTSIGDISSAMQRLLADKGTRQKLIEKGFMQAKKFTWEKTARETLRVFEKVYEDSFLRA